MVHLRYAYSGEDFAEGERLLAPMTTAGTILLADLSAERVDALLDAAGPQRDVPLIMVEIRQLGGALARQPKVPNAVAGRGAPWLVFVLAPAVPELAQVVPADGRSVLAALEPWKAPGCLLNHLGEVSGSAEVTAAYPPATVERLREVERTVDPDGVFSFGHAS